MAIARTRSERARRRSESFKQDERQRFKDIGKFHKRIQAEARKMKGME